jgi:TldD protein
MIQKMKNGLILSGFNGGQTNPTIGTYQFGIKEAKIVEKGEIKETRVNLSYSGSILNSLKNIIAVSKDIKMDSPGFCGKEDQSGLPCDSFDPYILIKNVRLG